MWRVFRERRDLIVEMEMLAAVSAFNDAYSDDNEDDIIEEANRRPRAGHGLKWSLGNAAAGVPDLVCCVIC